jgi:two-component system, OmpR family, sensor kinase
MLGQLRQLSISSRSFLLVLASLIVAEGIGLTLVINRPPIHNAPVSIATLGELLRPDRGPGVGPPPPHGGPPPSETRAEVLRDAPQADSRADPVVSARIADLLSTVLGIPVSRIVANVPSAAILGAREAALLDRNSELGEGFVVAAQRPDGLWQTVISKAQPFPNPFQRQLMWLTALGLVILLPIAWLFARALTAPLRRFAEGAQRLGRDPTSQPLPSTGPREMQTAVDAFNTMQSRVNRLLQERTQMIGAIAHDLRTPLTRLAFRLEGLPSPMADKVNADIQEMKEMISATLDFVRERATSGTRERLDLRLLIERIVDDHDDLGHDVTLANGAPVNIEGVPVALRRMLVNLVENALKYGERARLRLAVDAGYAIIEVDDDGPGIPENRQQQVFEPFVRLESSRNRDTGGIGLGLATVRAIVLDHGGEVAIGNRPERGLRVTVRLPFA